MNTIKFLRKHIYDFIGNYRNIKDDDIIVIAYDKSDNKCILCYQAHIDTRKTLKVIKTYTFKEIKGLVSEYTASLINNRQILYKINKDYNPENDKTYVSSIPKIPMIKYTKINHIIGDVLWASFYTGYPSNTLYTASELYKKGLKPCKYCGEIHLIPDDCEYSCSKIEPKNYKNKGDAIWRGLYAFNNINYTPEEIIEYELTTRNETCGFFVDTHNCYPAISHCPVYLQIGKKPRIAFDHDVYSELNVFRRLYPTQPDDISGCSHTEVFIKPKSVMGIVINKSCNHCRIKPNKIKEIQNNFIELAKNYNLAIAYLENGNLTGDIIRY